MPTTAEASNSGSDSHADGIDLDLLARVIYAEARGEPFEGQVAVGAVLINRVRSPKFPNDLWSVVFKKGEFCTVRDGQIWLRTGRDCLPCCPAWRKPGGIQPMGPCISITRVKPRPLGFGREPLPRGSAAMFLRFNLLQVEGKKAVDVPLVFMVILIGK